jgi:glycosyltransferase involved in cell wall biosynthesis
MTKMRILLAIPIFNEAEHLNAVLDEVGRYIDDIVVIDDGSTDGSKVLLARRENICVISHPHNRGYGQTIIDAFHFACGSGYDWVITMDCDLQHEPARIPDFIAEIKKDDSDIINGSRYLAESKCNGCPPPDRRKINEQITDQINQRLGLQLTDAFCGFKAHRVAPVVRMELKETGYAIPLEFWVQAAVRKLRIREIPISLIYNDPNRSFGDELDDPKIRLAHYQEVFKSTLQKTGLA